MGNYDLPFTRIIYIYILAFFYNLYIFSPFTVYSVIFFLSPQILDSHSILQIILHSLFYCSNCFSVLITGSFCGSWFLYSLMYHHFIYEALPYFLALPDACSSDYQNCAQNQSFLHGALVLRK